MMDTRPRIIVCHGGIGLGGDRLVQRFEADGCVVERTSSVRRVLESARVGIPSAIVCETILEDGTATMLYDLIERDFPRPAPPIFVVAGLARELSLAQRRHFSGIILASDEEAVSRIVYQVSGFHMVGFPSRKLKVGC